MLPMAVHTCMPAKVGKLLAKVLSPALVHALVHAKVASSFTSTVWVHTCRNTGMHYNQTQWDQEVSWSYIEILPGLSVQVVIKAVGFRSSYLQIHLLGFGRPGDIAPRIANPTSARLLLCASTVCRFGQVSMQYAHHLKAIHVQVSQSKLRRQVSGNDSRLPFRTPLLCGRQVNFTLETFNPKKDQ